MKYSSRFFLYAPLAPVPRLWRWRSASIGGCGPQPAAGFEASTARDRAGHDAAFRRAAISGFPFSLDTRASRRRLRVATPRGSSAWRTEEFAMHALTYGRAKPSSKRPGQQELRWTKRRRHAKSVHRFVVGSLHASAIERPRRARAFRSRSRAGFGSRRASRRSGCNFIIRRDQDRHDSISPSWPTMSRNLARTLPESRRADRCREDALDAHGHAARKSSAAWRAGRAAIGAPLWSIGAPAGGKRLRDRRGLRAAVQREATAYAAQRAGCTHCSTADCPAVTDLARSRCSWTIAPLY